MRTLYTYEVHAADNGKIDPDKFDRHGLSPTRIGWRKTSKAAFEFAAQLMKTMNRYSAVAVVRRPRQAEDFPVKVR